MHHVHAEASRFERTAHVIGALFGTAKDQHALGRRSWLRSTASNELLQELGLLSLRYGTKMLLHGVGGLPNARNFDVRRIVEHRVDGRLDAGGNRCREEQVLPLARKRCHDAAHTRPKAHVEHAVCLI